MCNMYVIGLDDDDEDDDVHNVGLCSFVHAKCLYFNILFSINSCLPLYESVPLPNPSLFSFIWLHYREPVYTAAQTTTFR